MTTGPVNLLGLRRDQKQIMCSGVAPRAARQYVGRLDGEILTKQPGWRSSFTAFNWTGALITNQLVVSLRAPVPEFFYLFFLMLLFTAAKMLITMSPIGTNSALKLTLLFCICPVYFYKPPSYKDKQDYTVYSCYILPCSQWKWFLSYNRNTDTTATINITHMIADREYVYSKQ